MIRILISIITFLSHLDECLIVKRIHLLASRLAVSTKILTRSILPSPTFYLTR